MNNKIKLGVSIGALLILAVTLCVFVFLISRDTEQNKKEIKTDAQTAQQSQYLTNKQEQLTSQKQLSEITQNENKVNAEIDNNKVYYRTKEEALAAALGPDFGGSDTPEATKAALVSALSIGDMDKALLQFYGTERTYYRTSFETLGINGMKRLSDIIAGGVVIEQTDSEASYKTKMIEEKEEIEMIFRLDKINGKWFFTEI